MAESLVERLAAVLDQHMVVDVVEAWKQPAMAHWSCACGEKGEPRPYDSGSALTLLAEMRGHVAAKLAELVGEVDHYRWMTTHTGHIGHADFDETNPFTQDAGPDEALARLRLAWWEHRPDVTTRLLRRPVLYGPWEEVA